MSNLASFVSLSCEPRLQDACLSPYIIMAFEGSNLWFNISNIDFRSGVCSGIVDMADGEDRETDGRVALGFIFPVTYSQGQM